ncbi:MAG: glycine zipper 2TM domain-containing protein [Pacificimonas sp.]
MLKPILIAATAVAGFTAVPAIAGPGDHYRGDYERVAYRGERRAERAYRAGYEDARRGYRKDDRRYGAKFARQAYKQGYKDARRAFTRYERRYDRRDDRRYDRGYDNYRPVYYNRASDRNGSWYGRNDRRYSSYDDCRRSNGVNTGTVVGGVLGGVLGNEVARRGDKTVGTIIGAAVGGVLGHEIGKGDNRKRYCY